MLSNYDTIVHNNRFSNKYPIMADRSANQKSLYLNSYLRNSNATAPRAASSDVKYKLKFSPSQSVLQGEDDDGDDDVLNDKNRTEKCMHKFISL